MWKRGLSFIDRSLLVGLLRKSRRRLVELSGQLGFVLLELVTWRPILVRKFGPMALRLTSKRGRCRKSREWLSVYDSVTPNSPQSIFNFRVEAFRRAWCLGDLERAMRYQDEFRSAQAAARTQYGRGGKDVVVFTTLFTANASVQSCFDVHLKAMALGLRPSKRVVAPLATDAFVWNPAMKELWREYVEIVDRGDEDTQGYSSLYEEDGSISTLINGRSVYIEHARGRVQAEWDRQGRGPLLKLGNDQKAFGREQMSKIGLDPEEPFVSLHVRDNGSKLGSWQMSGPADFRNADIHTYLDAIESLNALGFCVVRVGDPAMKPLPSRPGLIDYAHSDIRSSSLDLFLFTQCDFFFGMASGPITTPMIFGTPTLGTNYVPFCTRLHTSNSLFMPKRLVSHSGQYLTFEEALQSPIAHDWSGEQLKEKGFRYEENSPGELASACIEMVNLIRGKPEYSEKDEELSNRVNELYAELSPYASQGRLAAEFLRRSEELGMV